jgi:exonuclease III
MANKIVQWNCRGLKANFNEILLLLTAFNPSIVCLQETFLKENHNISFKDYTLYNHICTTGDRASGGSTIMVNSRLPHSQLPLNTVLQAVAVRVTLHRVITVCSVYLPPNSKVDKNQLEDLTSQLPTPYILLGDFNGHNPMWDCKDFNNTGSIIEDFISSNNLCLMNNKKATYLHPATGHYSSLDLALCHPSVYLDYSWDVHDDTCGSDHFPVILNNIASSIDEDTKHWRLNRANWDLFDNMCREQITTSAFENADNRIEHFTNTLHDIALNSIPKTTTKSKRHRPWFDENCKKTIRKRRASIKKFNSNPNTPNLENFRKLRAQTRKTIRQAKRTSWQRYVSKLNSKVSIKKVWSTIKILTANPHVLL